MYKKISIKMIAFWGSFCEISLVQLFDCSNCRCSISNYMFAQNVYLHIRFFRFIPSCFDSFARGKKYIHFWFEINTSLQNSMACVSFTVSNFWRVYCIWRSRDIHILRPFARTHNFNGNTRKWYRIHRKTKIQQQQ